MTSTPTKPVDNVVIATKGLQDRNTNVTAGTTVENKGKLILRVKRNPPGTTATLQTHGEFKQKHELLDA